MTNPNNPQDPNTIDENVETFDAAVRDTDNDGTIDTALVDLDGDGTIDTVILDSDGDGYANTVLVDVDGDGEFDAMYIDSDNTDGVLETKVSAEDDYVEGLGNVEDYTGKAGQPSDESAEQPDDDLFDFQDTTTEIVPIDETYDAPATEDTMSEDTFGEDMGDSDGPTLHLEDGF
nr:Uncharacterised protein [Streptococcus thermophilus]